MWDVGELGEADIARGVQAQAPRLVHAFHAWRTGALALGLTAQLRVPLVVTLTGTDANHDLLDAARAATVQRVLNAAAAVTVFHSSITARVIAALPGLGGRVVEIPQAVRFDRREPMQWPAAFPLPPDRVLLVAPNGIRAVKDPLVLLPGLAPVAARHPGLRLAYAGPILEAAVGEALLSALREQPWAHYLGALPRAQVATLLEMADVVVNSSVSEGGMANSVLEALSLGRAVLASDIEGNRSLIDHERTGLLFRDRDDLTVQAERLVGDAALRARLGAAGRARIERDYPPHREIDAYVALYRSLGVRPSR